MKTRVILIALTTLTWTFISSCEKDVQTNDEAIAKVENDLGSLPHSGVIFMDENEYQALPEINADEIQSLLPSNEIETRATTKRLTTPSVINQGQEGSCTAFATAYCVSSYYMTLFHKLAYSNNKAIRSPEYVYNSTKAAGSCEQAGAYLNQVLNFIRDKGVCSWSQMPYSDYNGCTLKPNSTQLSQGKIGKIKSWNTVARNVKAVKDLINKGYPVVMGFDANSNFVKQTSKMPYIYTSFKADSKRAGHAVTITGYDDNKNSFIVQNSWGKSNHDNGFFYISYNLFPTIATELFVMNPMLPGDITIRHASVVSEITIKINGVNYLIKKGQTIKVPSIDFTPKKAEIWECVKVNNNLGFGYYDCSWDMYDVIESKKYKITDLSKNYDLKLVAE